MSGSLANRLDGRTGKRTLTARIELSENNEQPRRSTLDNGLICAHRTTDMNDLASSLDGLNNRTNQGEALGRERAGTTKMD